MEKTLGEKWHEKAVENKVTDAIMIVAALMLGWGLFTAVGYAKAMEASDARSVVPIVEEAFADEVSDIKMESMKVRFTAWVESEKAKLEAERDAAGQELGGYPEDAVGDVWYEDPYVVYYDGGDGGWDPSDQSYVTNLKFYGGGSDGTYNYTWYSQNVMPGGGLEMLNSNGRHVDERDFVCDGDGYIAVAMDGVEYGTVIETPWGEAKVYDSQGPEGAPYTGDVDVYTNY